MVRAANPNPETRRPRIVYVTASLPYGIGERFVVPEIEELHRQGLDVVICPRKWFSTRIQPDTEHLLSSTTDARLLSREIAAAGLRQMIHRPRRVIQAVVSLRFSRTPWMLAKNLAVLPKALWLAEYASANEVSHIHAHWAGTTATLALIASRVSGVPFSFTAHRWDIAEDNLLRSKVRAASFARAIDQLGAEELAALAGVGRDAVVVTHMGVSMPDALADRKVGQSATVVIAATLVEKKGHTYLLQALELLVGRGVDVRLVVAGDGPEMSVIESEVERRSLGSRVDLLGFVPHDRLLEDLEAGRYDVAALPSIATEAGEREGIPVTLIEALAAGIPVVATSLGGIPELLAGEAGVLVAERDPPAIADAIERLITDHEFRAAIVTRGRQRVRSEFEIEAICRTLAARFLSDASQGPRQPEAISTAHRSAAPRVP